MSFSRALPIILLICVFCSCGPKQEADLVLRNGKVATVDADFSIQQAVAIQGDRIVFVGSNDEADAYIGGATQVIDLEEKLVLPGLIDGHAHMHNLGEEVMNLDIYGAASFQEIVDKVAERVKTAQYYH